MTETTAAEGSSWQPDAVQDKPLPPLTPADMDAIRRRVTLEGKEHVATLHNMAIRAHNRGHFGVQRTLVYRLRMIAWELAGAAVAVNLEEGTLRAKVNALQALIELKGFADWRVLRDREGSRGRTLIELLREGAHDAIELGRFVRPAPLPDLQVPTQQTSLEELLRMPGAWAQTPHRVMLVDENRSIVGSITLVPPKDGAPALIRIRTMDADGQLHVVNLTPPDPVFATACALFGVMVVASVRRTGQKHCLTATNGLADLIVLRHEPERVIATARALLTGKPFTKIVNLERPNQQLLTGIRFK